jgi:DNA polymerase-3 subunit epsilon
MCGERGALYLDTETTGLGPAAEIIDLAIVDAAGCVVFNRLLRPYLPIPADASFIHGIANRDVAGERCWHDVADEVRAILEGRTVIAYNAAFDRAMLDQTCVAGNVALIDVDWQCAMRAFTAYCRLPGQPRYLDRWQSLTAAAKRSGIAPPTHRALADALACREIVQRMSHGPDTD